MHSIPTPSKRFLFISVVSAVIVMLYPFSRAFAVPSYSRQTGLQCSACHTVFPELNAFGRQFKVQGYTLISQENNQPKLPVNYIPPLSSMLMGSYTNVKKTQPDTLNGNTLFPDQLSLFYTGRVADKLGTFVQLTYEGADDHFTMDNADVRWADKGMIGSNPIDYGVTLNNNPTVQDIWNSTPVWGFPYASSSVAPAPAAATIIDGSLGQQVAGLGGYALWNNMIYAELSFYRASQIGGPQPPDNSVDTTNVVDNNAPYWRLAYEHMFGRHAVEIGTYGMNANLFPQGVSGPTDKFHDIAFDAQYQLLESDYNISAHTTWIREKQKWNASFPAGDASNPSDTLKTFKFDASYYWRKLIGGSLGYFSTTGDTDSSHYPAGGIDGSRTGSPDSSGAIAQVSYLPWQNTRFSLQYTAYNKFNGASSNYNGDGRSASDNNTLYFLIWLMY